jgi:hypothetical protein
LTGNIIHEKDKEDEENENQVSRRPYNNPEEELTYMKEQLESIRRENDKLVSLIKQEEFKEGYVLYDEDKSPFYAGETLFFDRRIKDHFYAALVRKNVRN